MSEAKLDAILAGLTRVEERVAALDERVAKLEKRQEEMLPAFRAHWSDMSTFDRTAREELRQHEDRIDEKLVRVAAEIAGLRETLEAFDYHNRALASRVTALEVGKTQPI